MNKFVRFDPRFHTERLPMRYSMGNLSTIRDLFCSQKDSSGSQLPILPPKIEIIDDKNTEGYLVEIPANLSITLKDFVNQSIQQIQGRYKPNYDPNNPVLVSYIQKRHNCITQLQNILIEVLEQERRLGIYNLCWLTISKTILRAIHEVLTVNKIEDLFGGFSVPGSSQAQKIVNTYKIHLHHIFNDVLLETLKQVDAHFQKEDEQRRKSLPYFTGTKKLKLGASFNYQFSMAIIQAQAHMIFPDLKNTSTTTLLQHLLVEENERYHTNYTDFNKVYTMFKTRVEQGIQENDRTLMRAISTFLRIPIHAVSEIPLDVILFEPVVISYLSDEIKEMPYDSPTETRKRFFRRRSKRLIDLFGEDVWEMILYDYINLADDLRKSEIITFFRDRISIVLSGKSFGTPRLRRVGVSEKSETAEKITYNFNPGQKIISDLRNVTLLFLDLRGYTEVSGDITSEALKQNLYKFFDPTMDIIDHFHGSIKYYAGDGILAAFSAGPWKDYHGLNAVRAAVEIQKVFKALKDEGNMIFQGMGIGIHSGPIEDAYFFLNPIDKSTTVIGFTANLTSRLSSGKTERRKQKWDIQSIFTLNEYLMNRAQPSRRDSTTLAIFEEQLLQILDNIQEEKLKEEKSQAPQKEFEVSVVKGVLNNNGIALSDTTFQAIRETSPLKEIPSQTTVNYLYEDKAIGEEILFKKAGDASFKGVEGKFPIWGVYLNRWLK